MFAKQTPDKPAYIMADSGEEVSYSQLDRRSNRAAQLFRKQHVKVQDGVVLFAENHARFIEICWATQRSGLYLTAISWHLTAPEVLYILRDSGAKVFIASKRFQTVAEEVASGIDDSVCCLSIGGTMAGFEEYERLRDHQPSAPIDDQVSGMPMLYTSGTTGKPKGVRRPFESNPIDYVGQGDMFFYQAGFNQEAIGLAAGPLYHTAPMNNMLRNQRFGGTSVVIDKFDPENLLRLVEHYSINLLTCVPTHFIRLLKLPKHIRNRYDLSSLQLVLHTAAPCPVETKHAMIDWLGPILFEYYGGTEGIGGTMVHAKDWLRFPGTIGKPVGGSVYVLDESTWQQMPTGKEGVLYFDVTGDFKYHGDPKKTESVTSPQGWRTLGDIGYVNKEGFVFLTDRKANMIITGGVNVYPQEAENRLLSHSKVADAAVFGIANTDFGQEVKAVVQLIEGITASEQLELQLIEYCKQELSAIKCPRSIDFMEKLPREANGKLYKKQLQQQYL